MLSVQRPSKISEQQTSEQNPNKMLALGRRVIPTLSRTAFLDFPYDVYAGYAGPQQNYVSAQTYSQQAKIPADDSHKEKPQNLLRYPAFPLKETIEKFLKTVEPILNDNEFRETKELAEEFVKKDGAQLQSLLQEVAEKEENWLANRWQRVAYFQYRDPVTVFSSPGMTFPMRKFADRNDYVLYTAKLIFGMLKFKELIDNNKIPVAKMGEHELDNSQFKRVFGTCRTPQPEEDTIEYHPDSKHIVIIHKNHFHKLTVYNFYNEILSATTIAKELKKIMHSTETRGTPFGILTTDYRDNWAKSYKKLIRSHEFEPEIKDIQSSLFTVSLDEHVETSSGEELNVLAGQLIHGGGSCENAGNRWMDKTIQLCVNPNGSSGFTYENSPAEGQPIAMIVDYVVEKLATENFFDEGAISGYEAPKQLTFRSSPCLENFMAQAEDTVNKLARNLHMKILCYEGYGKSFLKQQKLSPDSFVQMALQYAFYAMHRVPGVAYESAHLRVYNGGRTETIRSCSNESVAFAKAMCSDDQEDAAKLLRQAVETHRKYTMDALMGRGVDRHLLGLKLMALENDLPIPSFYKSPGYIKSSHFRLSTSQVASKYKTFMCYGPLTNDGYGCCYNPRESSIIFAISSWRSNKETDSDRFAKALKEALDMMRMTLMSASKHSSKL